MRRHLRPSAFLRLRPSLLFRGLPALNWDFRGSARKSFSLHVVLLHLSKLWLFSPACFIISPLRTAEPPKSVKAPVCWRNPLLFTGTRFVNIFTAFLGDLWMEERYMCVQVAIVEWTRMEVFTVQWQETDFKRRN